MSFIVANKYGFCLIHQNTKEIKKTIEDLKGHLEWIEKEKISPPYLYMNYDIETKGEEKIVNVDRYLTDLKKRFTGIGEKK